MDAELVDRVLECLRGCEIGESISADGIADEIGGKLSDVYDALEDLENAKLVEMHPAFRKGSDPTYTLTPKGKRYAKPEVQERSEPEPVKVDQVVPELRPSADRLCRFCGKVMEPNKLRRHENLCGKNPDSVSNSQRRKATKEESIVTNATAVLEHEVEVEPEIHEVLEQLNAEPDIPDEVPDYPPANNPDAHQDDAPVFDEKAERVLGRIEGGLEHFLERVQASDALVLKGSPGMDAALRLIAFCQRMAGSGAQVSVDATVQISEGFHIHVDLCVPAGESDE